MIEAGQRPIKPSLCADPRVWDLVTSCWAHDSAARPDARVVYARLVKIQELGTGDEGELTIDQAVDVADV